MVRIQHKCKKCLERSTPASWDSTERIFEAWLCGANERVAVLSSICLPPCLFSSCPLLFPWPVFTRSRFFPQWPNSKRPPSILVRSLTARLPGRGWMCQRLRRPGSARKGMASGLIRADTHCPLIQGPWPACEISPPHRLLFKPVMSFGLSRFFLFLNFTVWWDKCFLKTSRLRSQSELD